VSKTLIICATVMFLGLVSAFVLLTVRGIDTTTLTAFVLLLVSNVVPNIAAFIKAHQINKKMDTVVEHTNGPIAETVQSIKDMRAEIHSMVDTTDNEGKA
jgi:hypothetical protein